MSADEPPFNSLRIEPTSCRCGGSYAWLGERPSGAWQMIGCVCHTVILREWLGGDTRDR